MPGKDGHSLNPFGSANIVIEVLENTGNLDLEVLNGKRDPVRVNVFNNILVQTGGTIIGKNRATCCSPGDITVRAILKSTAKR